MLTKVILEGQMGKQFGRVWELAVTSPGHALRMIEANRPGLFGWIRSNLEKYACYRVIVENEDGSKEHLNDDTVKLERKVKSIRFVPLASGAGAGVGQFLQIVVGITLIVVGVIYGQPALIALGSALVLGGVAAMLAPKPDGAKDKESKSSYYFDGPTNTSEQGVPVQLTYGRCLVGSHTISAAVTVDQLM